MCRDTKAPSHFQRKSGKRWKGIPTKQAGGARVEAVAAAARAAASRSCRRIGCGGSFPLLALLLLLLWRWRWGWSRGA